MAILTGTAATIATVAGATAAVGSAAYGIASAEKQKKTARKQEKNAKSQAASAQRDSQAAAAALARLEAESAVPGFGDSNYIPGYKGNAPSFSQEGSSMFALGNPTIYSPDGLAMGNLFEGTDQRRRGGSRFDDRGPGAPGELVLGSGSGPGDRGVLDQIRKQINFQNGRVSGIKVTNTTRQSAAQRELLRRRWNEVTSNLKRTPDGKPILPDPNTTEGQRFYASLPKSVAEIATDPRHAQMYKGSNIVNPYANIRDLSGIAEDVSDLVRDRSDLLSDRTGLIEDRTGLLKDRGDLFVSAEDLGQDLSTDLGDLSTGLEDLSGRITDLRQGAQDFSGLASDTSVLASNPYGQLQVATQAADLKVQQSDQALANTLSTIRATGAGAGGATAIAQAALQSKLGVAATIEQQEAKNTELRAQGQQQIEQIKMGESRRLQDIAYSERLRIESLRQGEGVRIDETRLGEGRRLQGLGIEEGRRLQGIGVEEGRRLQGLSISERMREQGLTFDEALRLQTADFETARERDRIQFDEAGRLEEARFNEAGRMQSAQVSEALRLQQIKLSEQQRIQNADAMAREYQFATAERREQNKLNRAAGLETQAMQTSADLQANAMAASANTAAAKAASTAAIVQGGLSIVQTGISLAKGLPTKSQKAFKSSFQSMADTAASQARTSPLTTPTVSNFVGNQRSNAGMYDLYTPNLPNYGGGQVPLLTNKGSDRRLKKNIKLIGKSNSGLNIYMFEYIDKIFGSGIYQGVMSDEIPQYAVIKYADGYDRVDYSKIDVDFKQI